MRQVTKRLCLFASGILFTYFYCEYLIYYLVAVQCSWPSLEVNKNEEVLKAFVLADTHLLGPWRGHWLDKWRREWQMHQAFQAIITVHNPDVVFVLGDLFDEGEWSSVKQFEDYVERYFRLFALPPHIKMHVVAGNHDIGFHHYIRRGSAERFARLLKSPSVQMLTIKNSHFVLLNSMAMEGDNCHLCKEARKSIDLIAERLRCSEVPTLCHNKNFKTLNYSRPILMQHFPLYRYSDAVCTEPDAPPFPERNKPFRLKIDSLSKEATEYLVASLKPRVVFGGHTHHGCLLTHQYEQLGIEFLEHSVPSFSWRNRPDPKYMLVTISPEMYAVNKCGLPKETTIMISAVILLVVLIYLVMRVRLLGRR